jgi:hypothetical protein
LLYIEGVTTLFWKFFLLFPTAHSL